MKKKHWVLRIVLALVVILLLIAAVVQIVLRTDIPRGIVVSKIEAQLGLRLSVKTLSTGWLGNTQLNDVTIGLPLADKAFLDVPVMKVKNTSLFGLLLGRPVELKAIELDRPHLYVWQDSDGRWNLQQAAELLARAGGKKSGEESAATSTTPKMPRVHLVGGIISVVDNQHRSVEIEPLAVDGYADSAVSWKYDVEIPSHVSISGKLAPGGNWGHEVAVKLQNLGVWARPWMKDFPDAVIDAEWRGALSEAGLGGRLDIHKLAVGLKTGSAEAYGAINIQAAGAAINVQPDKLLLKSGIKGAPDITFASGLINFNTGERTLKTSQLLVSVFGGAVKVAADYNLNTSDARLQVGWDRLAMAGNIVHSGALEVTLRKPFPDKIMVDGHLTSAGNQGPGLWLATASFGATGQSFTNFNWHANADKLEYQRLAQGINLDGLKLVGTMRPDAFRLTSATLPYDGLLNGAAAYALNGKQQWEAHLEGQRWPFKLVPGTELGFVLNARGDQGHVLLENFVLKSPDAVLSANAVYTFGIPRPLDLNVTITNAPPTKAPVAVASSTEAKVFNGSVDGHFRLVGTVAPLNLDVLGELDGREIDVRGHHLGNLRLAVAKQSHVDPNGVFLYTESLALFGGKWGVDAIYVPDYNDLAINLDLQRVALKDLAQIAGRENVAGTLDGRIRVSIPRLNFAASNIVIPPASFTLKDVNVDNVIVDQIDATLWLQKGHFEINPIHLKRGKGTGDVRVSMNVADFRQIDVNTRIVSWPIDIKGALAHVDASLNIPVTTIRLPNAKAADPALQKLRVTARQIDFFATTTLKGDKLGDIEAHAGLNGRDLDLRAVHMKLLGGRFDGQGYASADKLLSSTAEFTWENIDFQKLSLIFPQVKEMTGTLTGILRVAPTNVPRPREPLGVVMTAKLNHGGWRAVPIQDIRLAAYIGPNSKELGGGWRLVMEDSALDPSFVHLGGGTVEFWGRTALGGRATSSQAQITVRDLDLNQIVHSLEPNAAQMPGRIAGSVMLIRAPLPQRPPQLPLERMFPGRPVAVVNPAPAPGPHDPPLKQFIEPIYADGHIELAHANLANFGPFAALYDAARLFQNVNTAEGTGEAEFHLERGTVSLNHLRYFNRGTEIRTVATVKEIWNTPDSPINATVTLLAKPLRGVKLPFFADLSSALTAIQKSLPLTAVRVDGTLHKYKIHQLGFSELGKQMQELLAGDARTANGG